MGNFLLCLIFQYFFLRTFIFLFYFCISNVDSYINKQLMKIKNHDLDMIFLFPYLAGTHSMLSIESLPHEEQLAISSAKILSSWCWSCDFSDQVTSDQVTSESRDNRTAVTQRLLKMFDDGEVRVLLLFLEWLWYNYSWCRNFYWLGLEKVNMSG